MTNIGNAFIDLGALELATPYNCNIYSEMSPFLFGMPSDPHRKNYLNTMMDHKPKCAFFSGMVMCEDFYKDQEAHLEILRENNIPIVFNGVGGLEYSNDEISKFREFIKSQNFAGFISRDDTAYDAYHDLFPISVRGIDCAFFLPDRREFNHLLSLPKKYTVFNIETCASVDCNIPEYIECQNDGSSAYAINQVIEIGMTPHPDVEHYKSQPRTVMSSLPDEYIYLYGQSKCTFTTRVHSTIATLAFGGKAHMMLDCPRNQIFKTVGAEDVVRKPTVCNKSRLEERKYIHKTGLQKIMESI